MQDVSSQNIFAAEDFQPLLRTFDSYVKWMADRYFWGNRLLFLTYLDIAAAQGNE